MKSSRRKITGRDRMILSLLGEYGCVSADRIKDHFWKTTLKSRAHFRRISILKKHRLIENVRGDGGVTIGYRLTRTGKRLLRLEKKEGGPPLLRKSYATDFSHDQLLIDIMRILKNSHFVQDFQSEAEIKRSTLSRVAKTMHWESMPTIPDGRFTFKTLSRSVPMALELELTLKVKRRYARIFRNHLVSKNWEAVIYIVSDEKLRDKLLRILNDLRARDIEVRLSKKINAIYFCLLEDFQANGLDARLTGGKREFSLLEIAQKSVAKDEKLSLEMQRA